MDTETNTAAAGRSQGPDSIFPSEVRPVRLSATDRRLFFTASLGLLLRRSRHGIPVTASDLIRLLEYADPEAAAA